MHCCLVASCRYFSLQATEPLNMEDSVRMDVENRICSEYGPRADSFLRPQLVAFHTMNEVVGCVDSCHINIVAIIVNTNVK